MDIYEFREYLLSIRILQEQCKIDKNIHFLKDNSVLKV